MELRIKSCKFNMDTNCVEVKFSDGSKLAIDCEAVEDVYDIGVFERSELDWLIYNNPLEYATTFSTAASATISKAITNTV